MTLTRPSQSEPRPEIAILNTAVITLREMLVELNHDRPGEKDGKEHCAGYVHAELVVVDRLDGLIKMLRTMCQAEAVRTQGCLS